MVSFCEVLLPRIAPKLPEPWEGFMAGRGKKKSNQLLELRDLSLLLFNTKETETGKIKQI